MVTKTVKLLQPHHCDKLINEVPAPPAALRGGRVSRGDRRRDGVVLCGGAFFV